MLSFGPSIYKDTTSTLLVPCSYHDAGSSSLARVRGGFEQFDSFQWSLWHCFDILVDRHRETFVPEELLRSECVSGQLSQYRRCSTSACVQRLPFDVLRSQRENNRPADDAPQIDRFALAVRRDPAFTRVAFF